MHTDTHSRGYIMQCILQAIQTAPGGPRRNVGRHSRGFMRPYVTPEPYHFLAVPVNYLVLENPAPASQQYRPPQLAPGSQASALQLVPSARADPQLAMLHFSHGPGPPPPTLGERSLVVVEDSCEFVAPEVRWDADGEAEAETPRTAAQGPWPRAASTTPGTERPGGAGLAVFRFYSHLCSECCCVVGISALQVCTRHTIHTAPHTRMHSAHNHGHRVTANVPTHRQQK